MVTLKRCLEDGPVGMKKTLQGSVLERYAGFRIEETDEEGGGGGISVADIRNGFKKSRYGVDLKHIKWDEAVRKAVRTVFGCECDGDEVYPNLRFRSIASHAANCRQH